MADLTVMQPQQQQSVSCHALHTLPPTHTPTNGPCCVDSGC